MEKLLTKYFWILNVVTLGAVAYLLSSGTGELIAEKITSTLPKIEQKKTRAPRPMASASSTWSIPDGKDILERNIFDSTFDPLAVDEALSEDIDPEDIPDTIPGDLPIVPCTDANIKLIATVASKRQTDWSFASVSEGKEQRLCRVGDEVANRTVSGITWRYIFLRGQTDECFIDLYGDQKALKNPPKPPRRPPPSKANPDEEDLANGIQNISETEKVVDRSVVDKLLSNPTSFIRSVRVRPHRKDGKVVGFKLRRFRPNSPLAMLGAKRGDVIHSVNGIDLTSVDKALGAYQSLRTAGNLTFSITRNGKPTEINVKIR
ncbi:MAG: type II secretion system protein GspC [Myxococcota bacterium]|nr:type II secretion system protein GspC [Myxococcota bacterium]